MLLDARGHLKLTDLGLCKKVGEVSPTDHPDMVLKTLKDQGIQLGNEEMSDSGNPGTQQLAGSGRHRDSSDAMAMSIDDGAEVGMASSGQRPANLPGAKARREVSMPSNETMCRVHTKFVFSFSLHLFLAIHICRWHIQQLALQTTLRQKCSQLRMVHLDIRTLALLIGGHLA